MTIHDNLNSILAALTPSQYRKYWRKWKGLDEFQTTNYQADLDRFVEEYTEEHTKEFDEEEFRKNFMEYIKRHEDVQNELLEQILQNISPQMPKAYRKWGFKKEYPFYDEEQFCEDPDAQNEVAEYILWHGDITNLPLYRAERDNAEIEFKAEQQESLRYAATIEFEHLNNSGKDHGEKGKEDISRVYEDLFESMPEEFRVQRHGSYRIGFDIDITPADIAESQEKNPVTRKHNFEFLSSVLPEIISHYFDLLGKSDESDAVLTYFLEHPRDVRKDYTDGYYISPLSGVKRSLGKIFSLIRKKDPDYRIFGSPLSDIEKVFNVRPSGFKGKVIISRHPYDIAGMSTGRGWTSCMSLVETLGRENYNEYIEPTIMRCALIAYLVKKEDTNISNPTSRLLIKAYTKKGQKINYKKPNWVLIASDIYGTVYPKFARVVQEWANEYWNSKITGKPDTEYKFVHDFYFEKDDKPSVKLGDLR